MPERGPVLPHSIDSVDVMLVEGACVVVRLNLAVCDVHRQIVKVPACGNSTIVEPFARAVAKVEESVNCDHVGIGIMTPCVLRGAVVCEEESFKIVVSGDLNCNQADSYE